jgi:hypothetical protein
LRPQSWGSRGKRFRCGSGIRRRERRRDLRCLARALLVYLVGSWRSLPLLKRLLLVLLLLFLRRLLAATKQILAKSFEHAIFLCASRLDMR